MKRIMLLLVAILMLGATAVAGAGALDHGVAKGSLNGGKGVANLSVGHKSLKNGIVSCQKLTYDLQNRVCREALRGVAGPAGAAGPAGPAGAEGPAGPQGPPVSTATFDVCVLRKTRTDNSTDPATVTVTYLTPLLAGPCQTQLNLSPRTASIVEGDTCVFEWITISLFYSPPIVVANPAS